MQITLNHQEIEEAIVSFLNVQGIITENKATKVTLVAGRKENGHSATVTILPNGKEASEPEGPIEFSEDDDDVVITDSSDDNIFGN